MAGHSFLLLLIVAVAVHPRTDSERPGKVGRIERPTRGRYRTVFLGGVVVLGTRAFWFPAR